MFLTAKDKEKEKKKLDKVKAAGGNLTAISRTTSQESRRSAQGSKEVSRTGSTASSTGSQRGGEAAARMRNLMAKMEEMAPLENDLAMVRTLSTPRREGVGIGGSVKGANDGVGLGKMGRSAMPGIVMSAESSHRSSVEVDELRQQLGEARQRILELTSQLAAKPSDEHVTASSSGRRQVAVAVAEAETSDDEMSGDEHDLSFKKVDRALVESINAGENVRGMFAEHDQDEIVRIAGREGGVMRLAGELVELRSTLEQSNIRETELEEEVVKLKKSLESSFEALAAQQGEVDASQATAEKLHAELMELEVQYERTKDMRQEMDGMRQKMAAMEAQSAEDKAQVGSMAMVVASQVAQIEALNKAVAKGERMVASAKLATRPAPSELADDVMREKRQLSERVVVLEGELRLASFESARLEKLLDDQRKAVLSTRLEGATDAMSPSPSSKLKQRPFASLPRDPAAAPTTTTTAAAAAAAAAAAVAAAVGVVQLPPHLAVTFVRPVHAGGHEALEYVCPARPPPPASLREAAWRLDKWAEATAEDVARAKGAKATGRRKSILAGGAPPPSADLGAAVEWVLTVPEEGTRDGVAFRIARHALARTTEMVALGGGSPLGSPMGSPVKVKERGVDVACQQEGEGPVACEACVAKSHEIVQLGKQVVNIKELGETLAERGRVRLAEAATAMEELIDEIAFLVVEAGECQSRYGEAMQDWAQRVHSKDEVIKGLSKELAREREAGTILRSAVEAERESSKARRQRGREEEAQRAEEERRAAEEARKAAEERASELKALEEKRAREEAERELVGRKEVAEWRAREKELLDKLEEEREEHVAARVGLEEGRDESLRLLHEIKEARAWTRGAKRKVLDQITKIYGPTFAQFVCENQKKTMTAEGATPKRRLEDRIDNVINLQEGTREGGMTAQLLVRLLRECVASLAMSMSLWEGDLTSILQDFERFVIERGHADGLCEGETAFTAWRDEHTFKPARHAAHGHYALADRSVSAENERLELLMRTHVKWATIKEEEEVGYAAPLSACPPRRKTAVSIVDMKEHPSVRALLNEDTLREARELIASLQAENEMLQRKRQDFVREGMVKQAQIYQQREREALARTYKKPRTAEDSWDAPPSSSHRRPSPSKPRRAETPVQLKGMLPEPRMMAGAERMLARTAVLSTGGGGARNLTKMDVMEQAEVREALVQAKQGKRQEALHAPSEDLQRTRGGGAASASLLGSPAPWEDPRLVVLTEAVGSRLPKSPGRVSPRGQRGEGSLVTPAEEGEEGEGSGVLDWSAGGGGREVKIHLEEGYAAGAEGLPPIVRGGNGASGQSPDLKPRSSSSSSHASPSRRAPKSPAVPKLSSPAPDDVSPWTGPDGTLFDPPSPINVKESKVLAMIRPSSRGEGLPTVLESSGPLSASKKVPGGRGSDDEYEGKIVYR